MSNFKDQVAADIAATFLNPSEFAAIHQIDSWPILCVITNNDGTESQANADEGLWMATITLSAETSALARLPKGLPKANRTLRIDGKSYRVLDVADAVGITKLTMALEQS